MYYLCDPSFMAFQKYNSDVLLSAVLAQDHQTNFVQKYWQLF